MKLIQNPYQHMIQKRKRQFCELSPSSDEALQLIKEINRIRTIAKGE